MSFLSENYSQYLIFPVVEILNLFNFVSQLLTIYFLKYSYSVLF